MYTLPVFVGDSTIPVHRWPVSVHSIIYAVDPLEVVMCVW